VPAQLDQATAGGLEANVPMKSQQQRKFLHATKPEMAKEWEKVTPKGKKLPHKVKSKAGKKRSKA